jgi:nucleotide-binding universal stress UspA family protein
MAPVRGKVVVGVDGSAASLGALWFAVEEARQRYVPVRIVHVDVGGEVGSWTLGATATIGLGSADQSRGRRMVEDALVELFGGVPADLPISVTIAAPPIGPALVSAVSEPDLLIVGRSKRGLARRLFLGSVGAYCAAHAACPVVCVPRPEQPRRSYATKGRQDKTIQR